MSDSPSQQVVGSHQAGVTTATITTKQIRDSQRAYALRDELIALIEAHKTRDLVLNLGQVEFISSVGLLAFLGVRRQLPTGKIVLCQVSLGIQQMLSVCRLIPTEVSPTAAFLLAPDLPSALAQCGG